MKKKFLGIICFLYSGIILYVWIFNILKNFLIPTMQIYLKLSLFPMIIMGLILCFNDRVQYKFKLSDLALILPIILLLLSGDGRLTTTFATNRTTKLATEKKVVQKDTKKEEAQEEDTIKTEKIEEYDFTTVDYDVVDAAYEEVSNYITYSSNYSHYIGKTIRVKGFTLKKASFLPNDYFMIGKYAISCCAADASFVGFIAKYDMDQIKDNTWYEIEGVLDKGKDKEKLDVIIIKVVNIKEINSKGEEEYVYPCYSYDNGICAALSKYDLK